MHDQFRTMLVSLILQQNKHRDHTECTQENLQYYSHLSADKIGTRIRFG